MTKEAMKLTLEALEGLEARLLSMGLTHLIVYGDAEKAITNLQKQLAEQPAQQEPWCMKMNGCKTKCEDCPVEVLPAQQEPVAWINPDEQNAKKAFHWVKSEEFTSPVYTSPPQRTWVGLTDEEINAAASVQS